MRMGEDGRGESGGMRTGRLAIDVALGVGGLARGRIVEIFGPESSGKTTLALHAIACAQRAGGNAVLIDAEHAFDPAYGAKLGIQMARLWVSQPDFGERALDIAEAPIASNAGHIILSYSVASPRRRADPAAAMSDH